MTAILLLCMFLLMWWIRKRFVSYSVFLVSLKFFVFLWGWTVCRKYPKRFQLIHWLFSRSSFLVYFCVSTAVPSKAVKITIYYINLKKKIDCQPHNYYGYEIQPSDHNVIYESHSQYTVVTLVIKKMK